MQRESGSLETASTTNPLDNLDRANVDWLGVCVIICHFAAIGNGFHRCALRFHADVGVNAVLRKGALL